MLTYAAREVVIINLRVLCVKRRGLQETSEADVYTWSIPNILFLITSLVTTGYRGAIASSNFR